MKNSIMVILAGLLVSSCASTSDNGKRTRISPDTRLAEFLIGDVDELCLWTGATRIGTPRYRRLDRAGEATYYVEVDLSMRGFYELYCVTLDQNRKVTEFMPRGFFIPDGVTTTDVTEEAVRTSLLRSVSRLNNHLNLNYYGVRTIQRIGKHYRVTFYTLSPEDAKRLEQAKQYVLEPFVNFLLTEQYTVFGVYFGA